MFQIESVPIVFGIAGGAVALVAIGFWAEAERRATLWQRHYRRAVDNSYGLKWWAQLQNLKSKQPKRDARGRFTRKSA